MTSSKTAKVRRRHCAGRWLLSASALLFAAIRAIASGSVQLTWETNADPNVIGYNIYYGLASRTYTFAVPVGLVTNATVSGLREGVTYFFALVACSSNGSQSDFSDEISELIPITDKPATTFESAKGAYNGLFLGANEFEQTRAGSFSLFVNGRGVYSGQLQSRGIRARFSGQLDLWYRATNVVAGPNNNSFVVQFRIGSNAQRGRVIGNVFDGATVLSLAADRASFNAGAPAPFAGRYTCVLPGQGTDGSAPEGYGFGVAHVTSSGLAMFVGVLADGTQVAQSVPISEAGAWPFYAPLYSGKGAVVAWLTFTNRMNDDLNGIIYWTKPALPSTRYYSTGLTNQSHMIGSSYRIPSSITTPVLDLPNMSIAFTGGDLGSGFANAISIGRSSRVINRSSNGLSMMFSIPTGTFRGTVVDPVNGRAMPFNGVAFQKKASGYGLLLGTDQSSSVLLGTAFGLLSPIITSDLSDQSVLRGRNVTFSLTASGLPPLDYNWFFNGVVVAGAAGSSLTISNASNTGTYQAIITNAYGSATSRLAHLLVGIPPQTLGALQTNRSITFRMQGTPGFGYVVQAATNLTPPINWQNVLTNVADSNGLWSFTETNVARHPNSFFRAAVP